MTDRMPVTLTLHTFSLRFHFLHAPGFDVFRFIDRAVEDGFAGVALNANGPGYRHLTGTDAGHFARIRDRLAADRLPCDLDTSGTDPEHLATMLDVAVAVGATQLRTYTRHRRTRREMVERTTADLLAVAPLAADGGVRVLLENHEEFTGAEIAAILARVDSPWIAALYDYGNSMMVLEDPVTALEAMAPWARAAHLKDHVVVDAADAPDGRLSIVGVPMGQGNLPIVDLTRRLVHAGLDRITFENVWAYRAPVAASRPGETAAAGSCAPRVPTAADSSEPRSAAAPPLDARPTAGRPGPRTPGDPPDAGVFARLRPPIDPAVCLLDPEDLARRCPDRLLELEDRALRQGLAWLHRRLDAAGLRPCPAS